MPDQDWDDNEAPLAFLITFRTFGTWLHGDERYSVDRHGKNFYGAPGIGPNENLVAKMAKDMRTSDFVLGGRERSVVDSAIRSVCKVRGYGLLALNVRTNHVHSVVSAMKRPDLIMNAFKSNATYELRAAGLVSPDQIVWSRGGSTRYLWKPNHVDGAIEYVLYGQGDDLPKF
jgi:REP element-mobilizing transposase RayT